MIIIILCLVMQTSDVDTTGLHLLVGDSLWTAQIHTNYSYIYEDGNLHYGIGIPIFFNKSNYRILDKKFFTIIYDTSEKLATVVGYSLHNSDFDYECKRKDSFRPDYDLPDKERSTIKSYQDTKFDKGHLAPAGDFVRSEEAMATTFILSNIAPQTKELNRGIWSQLEKDIRDLLKKKKDTRAWIYVGCLTMSEDSLKCAPKEWIGDSVVVPTHFFKVVLFLNFKGFFAYGFLFPNVENKFGVIEDYIIPIDKIEGITKFNFCSGLYDELEDSLESIVPKFWKK